MDRSGVCQEERAPARRMRVRSGLAGGVGEPSSGRDTHAERQAEINPREAGQAASGGGAPGEA